MTEKWVVSGLRIVDQNRDRVCEIFGTDKPRNKTLKDNRARLIASAPDLLRALKDVVEFGLNGKTLHGAVAAITQAEGK